MHKRIVVCGKAASGKNFIVQKFQKKGYTHGISYTTRPPRILPVKEEDGIDYFFISSNEFDSMIESNSLYEYVSFNNWRYGTSNTQFYSNDIFIMTPCGVSKITPEDREKTIIIFVDIPYKIRRERLMKRSDADNVERRLEADEQDFENFTDFDIKITNSDF